MYWFMSKRSLFWGQASGKLGEAVYYRAGGEQRTRAYTATVKNPKSRNQAIQRTKMNNLVAVFKGTKSFVNSFMVPSKSGRSPFNEFVSENIRRATYLASNDMVRFECGGSNGYVFANGKLGELLTGSVITAQATILQAEQKYTVGFPVAAADVQLDDTPSWLSNIGTSEGAYGLVTGKQFYQLLTGANNPLMLPSEFNLSWVVALVAQEGIGYYVYTVKCSATSTDVIRCVDWPYGAERPMQIYARWSGGEFDGEGSTYPTAVTGATGFAVPGDVLFESSDLVEAGGCAAISYKDASGVQISRAVMFYGESLGTEALKYALGGEYAEDIISGYEVKSDKLTE